MQPKLKIKIQQNNQKGSTLIYVLIFSALTMAVMASLNSMVNHSINSQNTLNYKRNFNNYLTDLEGYLNSPQNCSFALNGVTLSSLTFNSRTNNITLRNPSGGPDITTGFMSEDLDYSLFNVGLHLGERRNDMSSGIPGVYYSSYNAKVFLSARECNEKNGNCTLNTSSQYVSNDTVNYNDNSKYQLINLIIFVDAGNQIRTCFGQNSMGTVCEYSGGVWNINEPDPKYRCNPYRVCFTERNAGGDTLREAPTIASATCNSSKYTPESVGIFSGRVKYICRWCNVNRFRKYP